MRSTTLTRPDFAEPRQFDNEQLIAKRRLAMCEAPSLVEVPGIEPGSDDEDWSLLRAQPQSVRSRLPCYSWLVRERSPVTVTVPRIPVTGTRQLVIFTTPEIHSDDIYGPTDFICAVA